MPKSRICWDAFCYLLFWWYVGYAICIITKWCVLCHILFAIHVFLNPYAIGLDKALSSSTSNWKGTSCLLMNFWCDASPSILTTMIQNHLFSKTDSCPWNCRPPWCSWCIVFWIKYKITFFPLKSERWTVSPCWFFARIRCFLSYF